VWNVALGPGVGKAVPERWLGKIISGTAHRPPSVWPGAALSPDLYSCARGLLGCMSAVGRGLLAPSLRVEGRPWGVACLGEWRGAGPGSYTLKQQQQHRSS
jgi:hypothetical protein